MPESIGAFDRRGSAPRLISRLRTSARWREVAITAALAAPLMGAGAWLVFARFGLRPGALSGVLALLLVSWWMLKSLRRIDKRWLVRRLDASTSQVEDSSDLLLIHADALSPLQCLQRDRLMARLQAATLPDLRRRWPWQQIAAHALAAIALVLANRQWSSVPDVADDAPSVPAAGVVAAGIRLQVIDVDIIPPAYTGLPPRQEHALDLSVPAGASVDWRLQLDRPAASVALRFHDGSSLQMQRERDNWVAHRGVPVAMLYRVDVGGSSPLASDADRLYRIEVLADQPPELRVQSPPQTLSLRQADQRVWELAFEASDDYGLAGAELELTLAQGSGENIAIQRRSVRLRGQGDALQQRFRHRIDLAALGLAQGDDLVARLAVHDNRPGTPNLTRSASFILRWPADSSVDSSGMDGLVRTALPAYFRSQRQLIIDTQALIAQKAALSEDKFIHKSDGLGVEQKILRLRYGQFMGEEYQSGAAAHADLPTGATASAGEETTADIAGLHDEHAEDASPSTPAGFGSAGQVLAEYGHTHDESEAATLLDPQTRELLREALQQMWRAEEQLRLAQPAAALPFEFKALEQIKRVQQATRIYLARVGLELPAIEESRRLSGERKELGNRPSALVAATASDPLLLKVWNALDSGSAAALPELDTWLRAAPAALADPLSMIAATDALLRNPECIECRDRLRALLWPLLPTPPAAAVNRPAAQADGRAYLDALRTVPNQ